MAYTVIADTQVQPDAPVTSDLMFALRDNPIAIAEGDAGAPRVLAKALDTFAAHGGFSNSTDLILLFDPTIKSFIAEVTISGASAVRVEFSNNGGASWSSNVSVPIPSGGRVFTISLSRMVAALLPIDPISNVNAMRFITVGGSTSGSAIVYAISST